VVSPRFRLSALNLKLLRDLSAMRGQALAIALVIAAGLSMFVMYLSNFESLRLTQQAYYSRQRFADVFAAVGRAPLALAPRLQAIPGVAAVELRVVADVILDVPGLDEPATGRLVSVPAAARPALNDLFLRRGEWVSDGRPDAVIAGEAFVQAHGFNPGDEISAVINGRQRRLTIAGVALSPEYVYSIRPGEIMPDARRFGVFWMESRALAAAFDMEGGFNDVAIRLDADASAPAVIAELDRLLAPYGGRGAVPRSQQLSHWMLESELDQLQEFGFVIPLIFLLVAAFVLNIALSRALALQRAQLAALKALGYRNAEIGWHYVKWALAIAVIGAVLGVAAGAWLGGAINRLYNEFFHFPLLLYRVSPTVVLAAVAMSLGAAAGGAAVAVRRAVAIPPAEALRPEAPARYRPSVIETPWLRRHVTTTMRMVLRNLERQPIRAAMSIVGIAFAGAILQIGFGLMSAMDTLVTTQFAVAERQDTTVRFVEPLSSSALHAVARLPGVMSVEPERTVAARLRAGPRQRTLAVTGVAPGAALRRVVDRRHRIVPVPADGLVISAVLADALGVAPGVSVTVEVLEGARPIRDVAVAGVVDDIFGLSAYMDVAALRRMLRESGTVTGADLLVDEARAGSLSARLKATPAVAGSVSKHVVVQNFRDTLAEHMNVSLFMNVLFAGIIAFGVIYNAARVSLSERSRELASLRVLGFTRGEISTVLLGELAVLTLAALPLAVVIGQGLTAVIVELFESEIYRFPVGTTPQVMAWSALTVIAASLASGLVVRRRLDRLDLVAVLKIRE
jgi:putative ABC transport system permease protein